MIAKELKLSELKCLSDFMHHSEAQDLQDPPVATEVQHTFGGASLLNTNGHPRNTSLRPLTRQRLRETEGRLGRKRQHRNRRNSRTNGKTATQVLRNETTLHP